MSIGPISDASKFATDLGDTFYQTHSEYMSIDERSESVRQRIGNFSNRNATEREEQLERCTMLHFFVDAKRVTEARYLISTICKEKLILMRVKPDRHSTVTSIELIIQTSIVQPVKDFMKLRFQC